MINNSQIIWKPTRASTITAILSGITTSLVYAFYLLAGNFRATFGPIDDHEPLSWLDGQDHLPLANFAHVLLDRTEVGDFGDTVRFRPSYYVLRVGQAVLFGNNPTLWYAFAFLIFTATVALLGFLAWVWISLGIGQTRRPLERFLALVVPVTGVIMFGSLRAWTGIVARLGPSELLAMLGVAMILVASTYLVMQLSSWWWPVLLLGTLLSVGAKENFLPIALVPVGVGLFRFSRRRSLASVALTVVSAIIPVLVVLGVSSSSGLNGTDVYGRTVGVARALDALSVLFGTYASYWIPGTLLLLGSLFLWLLIQPRPPRDIRVLFVFAVSAALLWLIFDAWTYRGVYEMIRYWMVFDFLKALGVIASAALAVNVLVHRRGTIGRGFALIALLASSALAALQMVAVPQSADAIREEVRANALAASIWNEGVAMVLRQIRTLDQPQVLVVPRGSIDFEPVIALTQALSHEGDQASVFVKTEADVSATPEGAPSLEILQLEGWNDPRIEPLSTFDENSEVLCVFLNAEPTEIAGCSLDRSVSVLARGI